VNTRQRIVVVVGLGVALAALADWASSWGAVVGWTGDAPLSQATFSPTVGLHPWLRLVIWLVATGVWTAVAVWLLRPTGEREGPQ